MSETMASILGTALYVLAGGMLVWAVLGPRIIVRVKRLRRCPKCHYHMSGTESMTCSECGYTARRERSFHRARTRKRWVLLSIVILPGAHITSRIPEIEERGWVAAVPTTVLILSMPWLEPDLGWAMWRQDVDYMQQYRRDLAWFKGRVDDQQFAQIMAAVPPVPIGPVPTWRERLYEELLDQRLADALLWDWQRDLLMRMCEMQCDDAQPDRREWDSLRDRVLGTTMWAGGQRLRWHERSPVEGARVTLSCRDEWPVGVPIYARWSFEFSERTSPYLVRVTVDGRADELEAWSSEWSWSPYQRSCRIPSIWWDDLQYIGTVHRAATEPEYEVTVFQAQTSNPLALTRWSVIESKTLILPVAVGGSIDSILTPVRSEALEEVVQVMPSTIAPRKTGGPGSEGWCLRLSSDLLDWQRCVKTLEPDVTLAFRAEVRRGDRTIGIARAWYQREGDGITPIGFVLELHDVDEAELRRTDADEPVQLRLVSDPEMALRNASTNRYWQGDVIVPVLVDLGD